MEYAQLEELWQMLCSFEEEKWQSYSQSLELAGTLTDFCEENPRKPIYGNNVLAYLNPTEPKTSWIIREILAYREKKSYPLLQNFLNRFFGSEYKVDKPRITAEIERIDVLVRDSRYVLVVENKLKGAVYQQHQLARYIARMEKEHPNKEILMALVPDRIAEDYADNLPLSVWRLPSKDGICDFRCNGSKDFPKCEHCKDYRKEQKTIVLTDNFAEWLSSLPKTIPEREIQIISTINQFSDYLNKKYNIDVNKEYNMDVQKFLRQQLDLNGQDIKSKGDDLEKIQAKLAEVNELQQHLKRLYDSAKQDFIEKCHQRIMQEYPGLRHNIHHPDNQGWETGIETEYKGITMWAHINCHNSGDINTPRWGLWLEKVSDDEINIINNEILASLGGKSELVRCGSMDAQLFVPSEYLSVYDRWKELMDAIFAAKRKNERK